MNLYKILMQHYAPKDSQVGIVAYLVAKSGEEVYEWLKSEPKLPDDIWVYTPYNDNEHDGKTFDIYDADYNVVGEESYKDRMIRLQGEMFDEEVELSDLYYGKTLYGWKLIKEDISPDVLQMIKDYGISIEQA